MPATGMLPLIEVNGPQVLVNSVHGQGASLGEILGWLLHEGGTALMLVGTNMVRLFARPDNVYFQSWLGIAPACFLLLHQALVLGAFLSLPQLAHERRLGVLLLVPCGALIYALAHIEARY